MCRVRPIDVPTESKCLHCFNSMYNIPCDCQFCVEVRMTGETKAFIDSDDGMMING